MSRGVLPLMMASTVATAAHAQQQATEPTVAAYQQFRSGFELRVGGRAWSQSRTIALSVADCAPAVGAPCGPGAKPLVVDIRFAPLPHPVELYKALSAIGESMPPGREHYMVRPVPASQPNAICGAGMTLTAPMSNLRLAVNIANAGSPLPVTCQWSVFAANENRQAENGFDVVWSDTITLHVVRPK